MGAIERILVCGNERERAEYCAALARAVEGVEVRGTAPEELLSSPPEDGALVVLTDSTIALAPKLGALIAPGRVAAVLAERWQAVVEQPVAFWVRVQEGWEEEFAARLWRHAAYLAARIAEPAQASIQRAAAWLVPQPVFVVDRQGRFVFANKQSFELMGMNSAPERLMTIFDVADPQRRSRIESLHRRIFEGAEVLHGELVVVRRADGRQRWLLLDAAPYPPVPGRVRLAICSVTDISGLAGLASRLHRQSERLTALGDAAQWLAEAGSVPEAFDRFAAVIGRLGGAHAVAVYEPEEDGWLSILGRWIAPGMGVAVPPRLPAGAVEKLRRGEMAEGLLEPEDASVLAVELPWMGGRQAVALLARVASGWDRETARFLTEWSEFLGLVLQWGASHVSARAGLEIAHRLLETAGALQRARSLPEVLQLICTAALQIADGAFSYVHLLDPSGRRFAELFGPASSGDGPLPPILMPRRNGLSWTAIRRRQLVEAGEGVVSGGVEVRPEALSIGVVHAAAVPLLGEKRPLGVLVVDRKKAGPLTTVQRRALEAFAALAAAAVEGARLRQQLARSEERYRTMFEASASAAVVINEKGWILLVNRRFEELTGYSRQEIEGKMKLLALVAPEEWKRLRVMRARRLAGDPTVPTEYRVEYVRADGERRVAHASLALLPGSRQIIGTFVDLTEQLKLQRQLVLAERAAALGQLVAGVAHELNNPLSAILASAELALRSDDLPAKARRHLERIVGQTDRCRRIIVHLLTFARQHAPERSAVDVNALVKQCVAMREYEMSLDDIEVDLKLAPDLPPLWADPHQLQQVFLNLIINAHQAMADQGGGRLTIETSHSGGKVRIAFSDTGPGIAPELQERIFDPFFTTKPPGQGTGMGLSVSLTIVQNHGGDIWVESAPGHGACFVVELPLAQPEAEQPVVEVAEEEEDGEVAPVSGARVLVIDDEEAVRDVIRTALEADGYFVQTVSHGEDALVLLKTADYDAILCDIRMPGPDGPAIYRRAVSAKPQLKDRFIFITGDVVSARTRSFLDNTGARVLTKPFRIEKMRRIVAETVKAASDARSGK